MKLAKCHPNRKVQARDKCRNCYDKWLKSRNPVYKAAQISNAVQWALLNPDKVKAAKLRRKQKEKLDPQAHYLKRRNSFLKQNYGITHEDYLEILKSQKGGCALCFRKPHKLPLHIDHDHKTNKIRGLLCHQCNWYLGTIDADPTIVKRIIKYRKM